MIKALGLVNRRTIRAIAWANEENGERGGITYADAAATNATLANTSLAIESDEGSFTPYALSVSGSGLALAQIARPGAPVVYGSFTSNVDMKSGSPAFGTPEYVKAQIGAGQMARHVGLPWRSSNATASNAPDAQGAYESQMSLWGALLGGANFVLHAAGWLESGLSASYEKFILDIEQLQMLAEVLQPLGATDDDFGVDAILEAGPAGHFFGTQHTMARYRDAFYAPIVSDWRNFGAWSGDGARSATERAAGIWRATLESFDPPPVDPAIAEALDAFRRRRTEEGGAAPAG